MARMETKLQSAHSATRRREKERKWIDEWESAAARFSVSPRAVKRWVGFCS
jgi:hypothetical protein